MQGVFVNSCSQCRSRGLGNTPSLSAQDVNHGLGTKSEDPEVLTTHQVIETSFENQTHLLNRRHMCSRDSKINFRVSMGAPRN